MAHDEMPESLRATPAVSGPSTDTDTNAADAGTGAGESLPTRRSLREAARAAAAVSNGAPRSDSAQQRPAQARGTAQRMSPAVDDPTVDAASADVTSPAPQSASSRSEHPSRASERKAARSAHSNAATPETDAATAPARRRGTWRSWRPTMIVGLVVPALFGTLALPAYAAPSASYTVDANATILADTQSLVVSEDVVAAAVDREGYTATTTEELAAAKAAEAAKKIAESRASSTAGATGEYTGNPNDPELQEFLASVPGTWYRPLDVPISSGYGPRAIVCNGAGCSSPFHYGIDFPTACGTPIIAVAPGRVTFVGSGGAFGNQVIVDHGNGVESVYGHLNGSYPVEVGQLIEGGSHVANVGATGVVTACHLDLKIRVNGEHTNPETYLRARGVAI
ncbi:hypothetical protein GCM10027416_02520 [Okibacterium endophyticum]